MNDDTELHERLDALARRVDVHPDFDDLLARVTQRQRRLTRALAGAIVVVLCVGVVAVVVAERGNTSSPRSKTDMAAGLQGGVVATHAKVPVVARQGSSATGSGQTSTASGTSSYPLLGPITGVSGVSGSTTPMAHVFSRTVGDVVIRAYRAEFAATPAQGPPWWIPPGWCFPDGVVQADVSDTAIAGVATASLYAAMKDGSAVGGTVTELGLAENAPRYVVVAQSTTDAGAIRAVFPDGTTDEMAPVDGVAVLVGRGPRDPGDANVVVTAVGDAGAALGSATLPVSASYRVLQSDRRAADSQCVAPQTLPPPGPRQPADPAAARQAVIDVFNAAYTKGISAEQFRSFFDDSHGFGEIQTQLHTGPYAAEVAAAQTKFDELVFLDPDTAAIQYEWSIPGSPGTSFTNRFTEAHLVNGQWKLARAGWCTDVTLAGLHCPA